MERDVRTIRRRVWRPNAIRRIVASAIASIIILQVACSTLVPHGRQDRGELLSFNNAATRRTPASNPIVAVGPTMVEIPNGLYALHLNLVIGRFTTVIAAEPTDVGFRANSRPKAASELIGGIKGALATFFAGDRLKGGAIIRWESNVDPETGEWIGQVQTPIMKLTARRLPGEARIELFDDDGRAAGYARLEPTTSEDYPRSDLSALVNAIHDTLAAELYNPELFDRRGVEAALDRARELADIAEDDLEFAFGMYLALQKLPFSQVNLFRKQDPDVLKAAQGAPSRPLSVRMSGDIATIRATGSWSVTSRHIEDAFEEIAIANPKGVILDLRRGTSGAYPLMQIAAHLLSEPIDAGVLFDGAARDNALNNQHDRFPAIATIESISELRRLLTEHGGIIGRIEPLEPRYDGTVVVLTSAKTASASEALAEVLQRAGRVTIIGEPTAGSMVTADIFDLDQGWMLQAPAYDYITANGVALEGRGVEPNLEITDPDEQERLARQMILDSP